MIKDIIEKHKSIIKEDITRFHADIDESIVKVHSMYKHVNDTFNYTYVKLKNNLKIIFIDTATRLTSCAQIRVAVGSYDDPQHGDGMAHFLEHMLFMGSKKYPDESQFMSMVNMNRGITNAFTGNTETQYFFSSSSSKFLEILDIFSRFFVDPLFDISYVEKELSAVDSEHQKNIGSDGWRKNMILKKFLHNKKYTKFGTGSKKNIVEFVKGDYNKLRDVLYAFWNKYYIANNMVLAICHNNINTKFIKDVVNMFKLIKTGDHKPIYISDKTIIKTSPNSYELIKMKALSPYSTLDLTWIIEGNLASDKTKIHNLADWILLYIMRREVEGSLYNILINLQYISTISVVFEEFTDTHCVFSMIFGLTEQGVKHFTHVIYTTCKYFDHLLTQFSNKKKFEQIFDEWTKINFLDFVPFTQPSELNITQHIVNAVGTQKIHVKYALISNILVGNIDTIFSDFVKKLKSFTLNKVKAIYCVQDNINKKYASVEPYYGTEYTLKTKKINQKKTHIIVKNELMLNPFAHNVVQTLNVNHIYKKLHSNPANAFYLQMRNTDNTNICLMRFNIVIDKNFSKQIAKTMTCALYISYIKYVNASFFDNLQGARYENAFNTLGSCRRISLMLSGHPFKIPDILESLLNVFFKPNKQINKKMYSIVFTNFLTSLKNVQKAEIAGQLNEELLNVLRPAKNVSYTDMLKHVDMFSEKSMEDTTNKINFENFISTAVNYLSHGIIRGIMGGSIDEPIALKIIQHLEQTFKQPSFEPNIINQQFEPNKVTTWKSTNLNPINADKAIQYAVHIGTLNIGSIENYKKNEWIEQHIAETFLQMYCSHKFFKEFRTENETGYIAKVVLFSDMIEYNIDTFIGFILQTQKHGMVEKIKAFIESIMHTLQTITDDEYDTIMDSIHVDFKSKFRNFQHELMYYYNHMLLRDYKDDEIETFDKENRMKEHFDHIDKHYFLNKIINSLKNGHTIIITIDPLQKA